MSGERTVSIPEESSVEAGRPLGGSFALSYLLAGLVDRRPLFWFGNTWSVLANTRFLDVLIRSGVVAYHDAQMGLIKGVPSFGDSLKAQGPVHWSLVFVAFGVFYFLWLCKGTQFNVLCRFYGVEGTWGAHAKAYYKGLFYGFFLPFGLGNAATIEGLRAQGGAVVNLVDNALAAVDGAGSVTIRWGATDGAQPAILVAVEDDGPGIDPGRVARLFETGETTRETGSGLGLPIALEAAVAHGGRIDVETAPGRGARFTIVLPLA